LILSGPSSRNERDCLVYSYPYAPCRLTQLDRNCLFRVLVTNFYAFIDDEF